MSETTKVEFSVSIGDFWKNLGFTKVPESYWNPNTWNNQADLLEYEDKKRFIFVSKPLNRDEDEDIQYQLIVKKEGKKIDPIGVVIIDNADEEMILLFPNEELNMFLQYFGRGDIVDNLLASGFIDDDDDDDEEEEEEEEEPAVDINLQKREEMENVIRQLGKLYIKLKEEYFADKTPEKLKEAKKAKNILQMKKKEYIEFVNSLEKKGTGIVDNPTLYKQVKDAANIIYEKPSAYKSGFIVKKYKELGGTYSDDGKPKNLKRWFKEEWKDIGSKEYPVYRPTKRITKDTPLTPNEIKPSNLKKQIALKQELKGDANLPPFEKKGGKVDEIWKWSNPKKVAEMAKKYLGEQAVIFRSTKPKKKYMIQDPNTNKMVHFGEIGYEDFTKHQDKDRRKNYLTRTANMKGNWKDNKYSANNLSRNILW
jgi:hypothetical protein